MSFGFVPMEWNNLPYRWKVIYVDERNPWKVDRCITLSERDSYRLDSLARHSSSPVSLILPSLYPGPVRYPLIEGRCSFFIESMMLTHVEVHEGGSVKEVSCLLVRSINPQITSKDHFSKDRYKLSSPLPSTIDLSWLPAINWDESCLLDILSSNSNIESVFLYRPGVVEFGKFALRSSPLSGENEGRFKTLLFVSSASQKENNPFFMASQGSRTQALNVSFTLSLSDSLYGRLEREEYGMPASHEDAEKVILMLEQLGIDPPHSFLCPITQSVMRFPCSASDGKLYEMTAIKRWIDGGNKRSPCTGKEMNKSVYPCHHARDQIAEWLEEKNLA